MKMSNKNLYKKKFFYLKSVIFELVQIPSIYSYETFIFLCELNVIYSL